MTQRRLPRTVENPEAEMPLLDHLEELRRRILISLGAAVVGSALGVFLAFQAGVMEILLHPLNQAVASITASGAVIPAGVIPASGKLNYLSLTEPFFFVLKIGMMTGLILVSPIIVYQIWAFLSPALEAREKRVIIPSLYCGLALFAAGVALAYFVALPMSIRFLLLFGSEYFTPNLTAGYYLSFVTSLLVAFGVLFEMPVVIMILAGLGLVTPSLLRVWRRHAYVLLTVTACALTPGDLLFTSVLLVGPLVVLYEVSILLASVITRSKRPDIEGRGIADAAAVTALIAWRMKRTGARVRHA
jgi:sec-independent protein translocase protein TatC